MEPSSGALRGDASGDDEEGCAEQRHGRNHEISVSRAAAGSAPALDRGYDSLRHTSVEGPLTGGAIERHASNVPDDQPGTRSRIAGNGNGRCFGRPRRQM